MSSLIKDLSFSPINRAYNAVFRPNRLSLGVVVPVESYASSPVPSMTRDVERVQLLQRLGFEAIWLRDVPFLVPSFGDAGQIYDPFVYLGFLAAQTESIALGVASIVLPLRHPAHVAKAAASVDVLAGGRLLLGVASGDRPDEYPAMNLSFQARAERFRQSFQYVQRMAESWPEFENSYGAFSGGLDLLPKPASGKIPLLVTGGSQQSPEWVANNGDGWMTYPRALAVQARVIGDYRERVKSAGLADKPVMQSLYIDVASDPEAEAEPIHLGFRLGVRPLLRYLSSLQEVGVNHVALNLRFNQADIESTLRLLAEELLPDFSGS